MFKNNLRVLVLKNKSNKVKWKMKQNKKDSMNPSTYLKESRSWDSIAIENEREQKNLG